MGTDVHHVFETKNKSTGDWEVVSHPTLTDFDIDRHYLMFAVMAGVRNGRGFAGCPTHDPIVPIAEPRGVPDAETYNDPYYEYKGEYIGDYGYSYLTVNEIIEWFKTPHGTLSYGVVSKAQYLDWNGRDEPACYSRWVSGGDTQVYSPPNLKLPFTENNKALTLSEATHVHISWWLDINKEVGYLNELAELLKSTYGEDTRIVFGFDS